MDKTFSQSQSNALNLLSALKEQQINLFLSDGQLKFTAPKGAMTPERIEQLRALKPELITILEQQEKGKKLLEESIMKADNGSDGYPLTYAQQRFWFLDQLAGGNSPIYNMLPIVFEAKGSLRLDALKHAFREIVDRHEVLSYRFGFLNGQPRQWRGKGGDIEFTICELDDANPESEQIQQFVLHEGEKPFDLQSGNPLVRLGIIKKSETHHILVLTLHHICADGWSLGNLIHELSALYEANIDNKSIKLPEINIQYGDYAQWERVYLDKNHISQKLHDWKKLLNNAPTFLDLPTDRPRPRHQTFNGSTQAFVLDNKRTAGITSIAKESGCTPFMILLSTFGLLLSKYSRQSDLVIGSPISNRIHSDTDSLIGLFLNTIPIRIDLSQEPTFIEVLNRVKSMAISAFELAEVPFDELLQSLNIERSLNHTPLFQVLFALQNAPAGKLKAGNVELTELEPENSKAPFDLVLSMEETGSSIHGRFRYNTDLFDRATIKRMSEHFIYLLDSLLENPNQNVTRISITTPVEIEELRENRGGTGSFRSDKTVHQIISEVTSSHGKSTALRFQSTSYSYEWLDQQSTIIAGKLLESGPQHLKRIGVCMDRTPDLIATLMAIIRVGGCYVPLDPVYPSDRLSFMIEDSGLDIVITDGASIASVPDGVKRVINTDELDLTQLPSASSISQLLDVHSSPEDPLYIIYTSGSTGKPKGVEVTHQNVLRLFNATEELYHFGPDDVWTLFHSYAFDFSVWEIFGALLYGGTLVIVPRSLSRTPDTFFKLLLDEHVTVLNQTPSAFAQLSEVDRQAGGPQNRLKWIIFGGEALDPRSLKGWFDRHGYKSSQIVNMYGITETTVHVTWHVISENDVLDGASVIGSPIPDLTLDLIDDYGQLVGFGVPGEIVVGGDGVANGYLNRPELNEVRFNTAEIFPGLPPFKAYRSGDLARRRHDGSLQYLGRIDFQVKIRGFRIELGEIESQIASFEGVASAAVKVIHAAGGDEIAGYVVFQKHIDAHEQLQKLRLHLKSKLPEYMVPTGIVVLPEMPLTANGKTDLRALPDPDRESRALETQFVAPRNSLETLISDFWKEILGIDKVGVHDNFFELGGDSIKGAVFANKMQEKLGSIFYVVAIFEAPTISELVEYIKKHYPEILSQFSDVEVSEHEHSRRFSLQDWKVVHELVPPLADFERVKTLPKNPKAIFVLAPPRSGTTLLRVLLGGHSKLFAPPELELMPFNTMQERASTYTGRDSFWLEGSIRAYMEAKNVGLEEAKAEIEAFERSGMSVMEFYGVLQNLLSDRILVDKSPSYVLHPSILHRIEETFEDAFYVHLHRHPLGMTHSFEEAKLHQIFFRYAHNYSPRQLGELIWSMSHHNIQQFLKQIPANRQSSISFENMTSDPEAEMERLCRDIGLDFEPEMLAIYREQELKKRMTDGIHAESRMLGDVKFHTHKKIDSNASERWKEKLDIQSTSDVTRLIAAGLGYVVPDPSTRFSPSELLQQGSGEQAKSAHTHDNSTPLAADSDAKDFRPLSLSQRRLWFFDQLDKGQPTYNMPVQLKLSGDLNSEALGKAIATIQQRHEVLRSTIQEVDGEPVAVIREWADPMGIVDLCHLEESSRTSEIERWIADFSSMPFLLDRGPLFKSVLLKCPEDQYYLLINMHHIVSDGWSLGIISKELEAAYRYHSGAPSTNLPELNARYSDYTIWQQQLIDSGEIAKQLTYWSEKLSNLPPLLEIPADLPRPPVKSYKGATHRFELGKELTKTVKSLAESLKVTPYMVLLSAFGMLLNKYTGKSDIPIGTPVANRRKSEFESLVGFFVNTQVLRLDVAPTDSFKDLVKNVRNVALEAYSNQDVSFEHLVEVLQPVRNMGYSPLFQVMLTMQTGKMTAPELPGVVPALFEHQNSISKYDLTLLFAEENDSLACYAEYSTDIFQEWRIRQLGDHFTQLLHSVSQNQNRSAKDIQLLSETEIDTLMGTWNKTQKTFDRSDYIVDLI
jgi:amino acid adenylation domain-containing protein